MKVLSNIELTEATKPEYSLALEILEGRFSEGNTVRIDWGEEKGLVFGK